MAVEFKSLQIRQKDGDIKEIKFNNISKVHIESDWKNEILYGRVEEYIIWYMLFGIILPIGDIVYIKQAKSITLKFMKDDNEYKIERTGKTGILYVNNKTHSIRLSAKAYKYEPTYMYIPKIEILDDLNFGNFFIQREDRDECKDSQKWLKGQDEKYIARKLNKMLVDFPTFSDRKIYIKDGQLMFKFTGCSRLRNCIPGNGYTNNLIIEICFRIMARYQKIAFINGRYMYPFDEGNTKRIQNLFKKNYDQLIFLGDYDIQELYDDDSEGQSEEE